MGDAGVLDGSLVLGKPPRKIDDQAGHALFVFSYLASLSN
jgi:hypothetical protein